MILFSLGPFGPFVEWWDAALARIVEIGLGPATVGVADTPEQFAENLIRSTTPHLVVVSRRPCPSLRALLAEPGVPLLIGLDDPREGLFDLVVGHGLDFRLATQVLADSCASAMIGSTLPKALVITSEAARTRTRETLGRIAQFCGLTIVPETPGIAAPPDPAPAAKAWWDTLDPHERDIAEGAFRGYDTWAAGHGVGETIWDRRLFCCAADHGRSAGAAIDIGETPGPLVDGPWIALTQGHWAASVTLAVSREVNGARFDIAVNALDHPGPLATGSVICDGRGLGAATLLFTVEPASGHTISLTIASTAPAPSGRLALGNVVLAPGRDDGTGVPAELSSALGVD